MVRIKSKSFMVCSCSTMSGGAPLLCRQPLSKQPLRIPKTGDHIAKHLFGGDT